MRQKITEIHEQNAGGETTGTGIHITWQNGPLGRGDDRVPPNGAFVEGVIQAAIGRLEFYQKSFNGKFACRENAVALTHLETALLWLEKRTRDREEREVEGTGSRLATWPATVKWAGGTAPTLSTAANAIDIVEGTHTP